MTPLLDVIIGVRWVPEFCWEYFYSFGVTRALWGAGVSCVLAQPEIAVFKAAEQIVLVLSGHMGYLALKTMTFPLDVMAQIYNPSTWEAEVGGRCA